MSNMSVSFKIIFDHRQLNDMLSVSLLHASQYFPESICDVDMSPSVYRSRHLDRAVIKGLRLAVNQLQDLTSHSDLIGNNSVATIERLEMNQVTGAIRVVVIIKKGSPDDLYQSLCMRLRESIYSEFRKIEYTRSDSSLDLIDLDVQNELSDYHAAIVRNHLDQVQELILKNLCENLTSFIVMR